MVAIHHVVRDVLAMIEPRVPVPKGGGRGGGSRGGGSKSSGSKPGSSSGSISSSSSTKGSTTSRPGFIFIGTPYYGGSSGSGGSYLPVWAFVLIILLSVMAMLFILAFVYYYKKERKRIGKTRWGKVFWGATKVATFLWIPILIYRCTCGRNRKKGTGGTFYNKIEEGSNNSNNNNNNNTTAAAAFNNTNTAYGADNGASGKPLLHPGSSPAYVPASEPGPYGSGPSTFGASVVQPPASGATAPPPPPPYGAGAAASYYATTAPSSAYIPGGASDPVPMSAPPASK